MTLYTKKQGNYIELDRDQIRTLRRVDQVVAAEKASQKLINTARALALWMNGVQRRALKMDAHDLTVTRLPNVERLMAEIDTAQRALEELRHV